MVLLEDGLRAIASSSTFYLRHDSGDQVTVFIRSCRKQLKSPHDSFDTCIIASIRYSHMNEYFVFGFHTGS